MSEKRMLSDYPDLVAEWDFEKNIGLDIESFSHGSNAKVWWKCVQGHSSLAIIANRTIRGTICRECSSNAQKRRLSDYEELVEEFSNENEAVPEEIRVSDRAPRIWLCSKGHKWKASAKERIKNNTTCFVCEFPENFLITYKDLMKEWDYEKNVLDPFFLTVGSSKHKIQWKCAVCDHEWSASVNSRVKHKTGCPACHKQRHKGKQQKKSLAKYGSIADSQLVSEWNYEKNRISPEEVSVKSTQYVWWNCSKGHEWVAKPNLRFNRSSECPYCMSKKVIDAHYVSKINSGELSFFDVASEELKMEWFDDEYDPRKLLPYSHNRVQWKCSKGHTWRTAAGNRMRGSGCPECWNSTYVSAGEQKIADYVNSIYDGVVKTSSRKTIHPYELDIYLPELNLAFEFNGIYWHREKMLAQRLSDPKNYHFNKWQKCKDKGIQLITIWEDDWRDNREKMMNMIAYKVGASQSERIGARKTVVREVSAKDVRSFLNIHHVQGATNGLSIGLFSKADGSLVTVAVFKKRSDNEWELLRYASSNIVQGGLGKILNYVKSSYSSVECVITFADHEVSDGSLYEKNGFEVDSILKPDYKYIYKNKRHHKFLFRKQRFEKDPDLLFDENMTEKELAELNNIHRVWDCGKTKYVKHF